MSKKRQFSTFQILTAIAGAFSLFSLLQTILSFGVVPVLVDFLDYYRTLARWLFGWIGMPFEWRLPLWLRDELALQFLCSSVLLRTGLWNDLMFRGVDGTFKKSSLLKKMFVFCSPFSIALCFSSLTSISTEANESQALIDQVRPFVVSLVVFVILFFCFNAYGLTIG